MRLCMAIILLLVESLSLFVMWINLSLVSAASDDFDIRQLLRKKRSLLFPNPGESETKVQVLFGLGLPMESQVSVILGYVLKCNYDLPYNASDSSNIPYVRYARAEPSTKETATAMTRWGLYRILEMAMESRGSGGKACLLRAICEASEFPFVNGPRHGLVSEFFHLILTPSTTNEDYEMYADREYRAAEFLGTWSNGDACRVTYHHECPYSPLDYLTEKSQIIFS